MKITLIMKILSINNKRINQLIKIDHKMKIFQLIKMKI